MIQALVIARNESLERYGLGAESGKIRSTVTLAVIDPEWRAVNERNAARWEAFNSTPQEIGAEPEGIEDPGQPKVNGHIQIEDDTFVFGVGESFTLGFVPMESTPAS